MFGKRCKSYFMAQDGVHSTTAGARQLSYWSSRPNMVRKDGRFC